jgi:hypothetical protein
MRTIYRSTVFDAPVGEVWAIIRDFNGWPAWLGVIEASVIEDGLASDTVGCVRALTVPGSVARERLLGLSDHEHTITYSVEEADLPINDYVATIRLRPVTDGGRTFAEWSGSFNGPVDQESAIAEGIGADVYESAFAGVRELLSSR